VVRGRRGCNEAPQALGREGGAAEIAGLARRIQGVGVGGTGGLAPAEGGLSARDTLQCGGTAPAVLLRVGERPSMQGQRFRELLV